jgi:hypothetical protein
MNINDLMNDLGINPADETPKPARSSRTDPTPKQTPKPKPAEVVPVEASAPARSSRTNKPEAGKVYRLIGKSDESSIARGDSLPACEVPPEQLAPRQPEPSPWDLLMAGRPVGFRFVDGISRTGAPYAFWGAQDRNDRSTRDLSAEDKRRWKACQGPATREVIDEAWRRRGAARGRGGLSWNVIQELKEAYRQAKRDDAAAREMEARDDAKVDAAYQEQLMEARDVELQARDVELDTMGSVELAGHELDAAFQAFRVSRDLADAAQLQRAMTAYIQAGE